VKRATTKIPATPYFCRRSLHNYDYIQLSGYAFVLLPDSGEGEKHFYVPREVPRFLSFYIQPSVHFLNIQPSIHFLPSFVPSPSREICRTPVESSFLRDRVCNGEVREIMRVDVKIAMRYKVRRTEIISTIRGEKYASV
jgi:hypothetical protein